MSGAPLSTRRTWVPPAPRPEDITAARQAFSRGAQLYSASKFAEALDEFETAYSYKAADPVLYNIGMTLEQMGRIDEAIDVFERFVATNPSRKAEVQQRIDALKKK